MTRGVRFKCRCVRKVMTDKIVIPCSECGSNLSVPPIAAGKKVRCPKCKTEVVIPAGTATVRREPRQPAAAQEPEPRRARRVDETTRPARPRPMTHGWMTVLRQTARRAVNGIRTARRNKLRKLFRLAQNGKTQAVRYRRFAAQATNRQRRPNAHAGSWPVRPMAASLREF